MTCIHGRKKHCVPLTTLKGMNCSNRNSSQLIVVFQLPPDSAHLGDKRRNNTNDFSNRLVVMPFQLLAISDKPANQSF